MFRRIHRDYWKEEGNEHLTNCCSVCDGHGNVMPDFSWQYLLIKFNKNKMNLSKFSCSVAKETVPLKMLVSLCPCFAFRS